MGDNALTTCTSDTFYNRGDGKCLFCFAVECDHPTIEDNPVPDVLTLDPQTAYNQ